MVKEKQRSAIVYDFDGTLARGNIQEQSFIPKIGMSRTEFWDEVRNRSKTEDADEILVYMHLMLEKAAARGIEVTREQLYEHGRNAALFKLIIYHFKPNLPHWTSRVSRVIRLSP